MKKTTLFTFVLLVIFSFVNCNKKTKKEATPTSEKIVKTNVNFDCF